MNEADLLQGFATTTQLAYTAGQWWATVTTALLIATYFAAKHIPPWFFALVMLLYLLTAVSVVLELSVYGKMSEDYGVRLIAFRFAHHIFPAEIQPFPNFGLLNSLAVYSVFVIGSFSAMAYSLMHWRTVRNS